MPSRAAARERYSFASLEEILEMPDLLAVQKDSFEWFMRHGLQDVPRGPDVRWRRQHVLHGRAGLPTGDGRQPERALWLHGVLHGVLH